MSPASNATTAAQRFGSGTRRLRRAYGVLPHERRLAAYASVALFLTLFLPWYQRQFFVVVRGKPVPASDSQTAWGAFSFVEAALLLVAIGVLTLLFQRAEGRAFHLPGGDGWVITAAGAWSCVLVVWRIFDKQGGAAHGQDVISYGIEWGIFVALAVAAFLTYAGSRIRAVHRPEPPLPGDARAGAEGGAAVAPEPSRRRRRPARSSPAERTAGPAPAAPDDDPTLPRDDDPTLPRGEDPTLPRDENPTLPRGENPTMPRDDDPTLPQDEDPTLRISKPSTQAARTRREADGDADDQLTIPFEGHEP